MKKEKFKLISSFYSEKGVRKTNDDAIWCGFNDSKQFLALVCDGVGMEANSAIASKTTIEIFKSHFLKRYHVYFPEKWFKHVLHLVYKKLHQEWKINKNSIKTTLTLCFISYDICYIFNIGDSRAYHYDNEFHQWNLITTDHNLFNFLKQTHAPLKSYISNKDSLYSLVRYISSNSNKNINYDKFTFKIKDNDLIFLATDGLYNFINIDDINEIISMNRHLPSENNAHILVNKSLANNSTDNSSGIVIEFLKFR